MIGNKGQGVAWAWVYATLSMAIVVITFIVFDYVIWTELQPPLEDLGLNMSTSYMTALTTTWQMWAVPFLLAWALYMIIQAVRREPHHGF